MGSHRKGPAGQEPEPDGSRREGRARRTHLPVRRLSVDHSDGHRHRQIDARRGGTRMSQNPQKPKFKIQPSTHNIRVVNQPMVRDFSTGGGHGSEDTLTEGDNKLTIKKWQGYPPTNLNLIGKPLPPMPEVAIPRYLGKAEYATRVQFPNMLHIKILPSPHPRAKIKRIDVSKAEKMPGVAYILTPQNAPKTYPLPEELFFQGEIVAMVAADTEDLAEDAVEAIDVEYDVLPFASTLAQ